MSRFSLADEQAKGCLTFSFAALAGLGRVLVIQCRVLATALAASRLWSRGQSGRRAGGL